MSCRIRLQYIHSKSSYKISQLQFCRNQTFDFSSLSKPKKKPQRRRPSFKKHKLFRQITEILGANVDNKIIPDEISSGFPISRESHVMGSLVGEKNVICTQDVCRNAPVKNSDETDVSPVVEEITEIVRAGHGVVSMEERLENARLRFESDVVEKVLKRCFKVPHLGLRFFNLVRQRPEFGHTTEVYNAALSLAGEAKKFELVESLLEEMEKNSCENDIKTWTCVISLYGKAKMIGKALLIFDKMKKCGCEPDEGVYKVILRWLCNSGKGDLALEFYKEMVQKEMTLNLNLYKLLMGSLSKSGNVSALQSVADDMLRVCQIPERDVYLFMLKSLCVSRRMREALELIRDLKEEDAPLDPEYFEILVKGLCRSDMISDALEIVDIMKRRELVDGKVYDIIINGYLRRNDLSKALDLFQSMKESGYLPTTATYTELMQQLFMLKEYKKGCELYDEMLERGIKPDIVAVTAMIAGHVGQNRISEAWEMFRSMEDQGIKPTWKSYSIFIKELCKASQTDEILKVLDVMQASKIKIGDEIFNWVISCMEKKGEIENIKKVKQLQRVCDLGSLEAEVSRSDVSAGGSPDALLNRNGQVKGRMNCHSEALSFKDYNLVAPGFKGLGEQEQKGTADRLAEVSNSFDKQGQPGTDNHMVKPITNAYNKQDLQTISKILSSPKEWCSIQEDLEKCIVHYTAEIVNEIMRDSNMHTKAALHFFEWVGKLSGYHHTAETYNMAIKVSGRAKDFKNMRSLFYEMRRKGHSITADTWTIMIMQYGRTGMTEIALNIFEEMKANGCKPSGSTYKYLVTSFCARKGRKVDEAITKFQEMIHAGHVPDKELVEIYLGCLCEVDKLQEARKCADFLCTVGYTTPLSYSMLIRSLCRAGRLEAALEAIESVGSERDTLDEYIYGSLVHALLQKGRLEEALAKIDYMKQAGVNPTVHVYTSLIVHFFKEKQVDQALNMYEQMQQEGYKPTIVTYSALIRGYLTVQKFPEAWDIFNQMKLKGILPDFKMYSMLLSCLCDVGKSEEALQLLSEMSSNGIVPSTINFRTVFFGLNREGKQELAQRVVRKKLDLKNKRMFLT